MDIIDIANYRGAPWRLLMGMDLFFEKKNPKVKLELEKRLYSPIPKLIENASNRHRR